jgi:hypothetical protein
MDRVSSWDGLSISPPADWVRQLKGRRTQISRGHSDAASTWWSSIPDGYPSARAGAETGHRPATGTARPGTDGEPFSPGSLPAAG